MAAAESFASWSQCQKIYIYTHTVYILYVYIYYMITACHTSILFYCHHHRKQKCDPVGCSGILKSEGPVCDGQDKNVGRPSQDTNPKQYQIESDRVGCKLQSAAMSQQFLYVPIRPYQDINALTFQRVGLRQYFHLLLNHSGVLEMKKHIPAREPSF